MRSLPHRRWLRIIPVALIMYTISYVDRTNVSLALEPSISSMMKDLLMDDRMKGEAAGIFFFGYLLLQLPGGYWASRWSARKFVSLCLIGWGVCAIGCGLARTFREFELARFFLGVAESGVFPATMVLLANWFPRSERARANAYWTLCQPLAIAGTAPLTSWLLGVYGWQRMLMVEGLLPFLWLPIWWFGIRDRPRDASWIEVEEREFLETTLRGESGEPLGSGGSRWWEGMRARLILVMVGMYFLQNCEAYGCMTFFTSSLKEGHFTAVQYGLLFALPYAITALFMVLNSWHSDKTRERRGHVALAYGVSGLSLILAVTLKAHFWEAYALMCLAIPGPFAAMGPFWAIPGEALPIRAMGVAVGTVNAFGNIGGLVGPVVVGWLKQRYQGLEVPFGLLGMGMLVAAAMALLLPKSDARPEL